MDKIYKVLKIVGMIVVLAIIIIPTICLLAYLRTKNKTIKFRPTIRIVDIETLEIIDNDALIDALNKTKEIFKLEK